MRGSACVPANLPLQEPLGIATEQSHCTQISLNLRLAVSVSEVVARSEYHTLIRVIDCVSPDGFIREFWNAPAKGYSIPGAAVSRIAETLDGHRLVINKGKLIESVANPSRVLI